MLILLHHCKNSHVKNYTVPPYPFSHVAHCSCTHRMYGGSRDIWLRVGSLKPDCLDEYLGLINGCVITKQGNLFGLGFIIT